MQAEFVFHNDGEATSVQMGFPESGHGVGGEARNAKESSFVNFATWVDGTRVSATRQYSTGDDESFKAFWVKNVDFDADQTRHTRVEYRSPLGGSIDGKEVDYSFTGGSWAGLVDSSDLTLTLNVPGINIVCSNAAMMRNDNQLSAHWESWKAEYSFFVGIDSIPSGVMVKDESLRTLNEWVFTIPGTVSNQPNTHLWDPDGLLREDTACVPLRGMSSYYSMRANKNHRIDSPRVAWDSDTREASITVGKKTLLFTVGSKVMKVNDQEIALPVAPFLYPYRSSDSQMFVPLRPIVDALGRDIDVEIYTIGDQQGGLISYELTDYWEVK